MSNSIAEMENLEAFIVTGSNTTETHPVIANFLKRAVRKNGAKLIVVDPRRVEMTDFSTVWLQQNPGTDVAVFQAMAHVIVKEGLVDPEFIKEKTEGFDEYIESLSDFTPEWAETVSGVPAESIIEAARIYAKAERASIYWGMGISQSTHGTDNTLSLVNLAMMCGHVGKAGTGLLQPFQIAFQLGRIFASIKIVKVPLRQIPQVAASARGIGIPDGKWQLEHEWILSSSVWE